MALRESCPGSREIRSPHPEDIKCIFCGNVSEIWSDETEIACKGCGRTIKREMKPCCVLWCPAAKDCLGAKKYEELMRALKE